MIHDFDDFCLYVYVIVDDIYRALRPLLRRPGPAPVFSDSELLAVCLVGECKGLGHGNGVVEQHGGAS